MPTQVQFRRGTTAQNNSFTGAAGELSVNTSNSTIRVHDGSTAGGSELASVTYASNATNILSGTLSVSRLATSGVAAGTYGGVTVEGVFTVDAYGRITSASNVTAQVANLNITGLITSAQLANTGVTATTYGGASSIPAITIDAQGRITSAANVAVTAGVSSGKSLAFSIVFS